MSNQETHTHHFHQHNPIAERNTYRVIWLTLVMMIIEVVCGWLFGSMALLADGWHMGTHFFALGITAFAYYYSRVHANDNSYSFGTGKVGVLGGYTSAIVLGIVALLMVVESFERLLSPAQIRFNEALLVAVIGLVVNLFSAWLLHGSGDHEHGHAHHVHDHDHSHHHHHHHDHNLRAAYMHVIADALTSLLAIVALLAGKYFGLGWLDPLMGIVGALVIVRWAYGLMRDTSGILLDRNPLPELAEGIRSLLEADGLCRVTDLHLWRVSSGHFAAIISLVSSESEKVETYREKIRSLQHLDHVTIEVVSASDDQRTRAMPIRTASVRSV